MEFLCGILLRSNILIFPDVRTIPFEKIIILSDYRTIKAKIITS